MGPSEERPPEPRAMDPYFQYNKSFTQFSQIINAKLSVGVLGVCML